MPISYGDEDGSMKTKMTMTGFYTNDRLTNYSASSRMQVGK